jgi:hypothetical protein
MMALLAVPGVTPSILIVGGIVVTSAQAISHKHWPIPFASVAILV